jgi:hypothetical protein
MKGRERGATQTVPGEGRVGSVGRKTESIALAVCLLLIVFHVAPARAAFTFDDIEFWVGSGDKHAALVIDWVENNPTVPALAWGYRWNGVATGRDMLGAIVEADDRLYVKFNDRLDDPTHVDPTIVYGIGYDTDNDGEFGIDDGTTFDEFGRAFGNAPFFGSGATDPGDYYAEGWTFAFWHFGVESPDGTNPYVGGGWSSTNDGIATRDLVDGSWDSWAFDGSTSPPFIAFAENPTAAPSPFAPGDFTHDGEVDAADYGEWAGTFGSMTQPAADANRNGLVDAADYIVWRNNLTTLAATYSTATTAHVPEPSTVVPTFITFSLFQIAIRRQPRLHAYKRGCGETYLRLSASICGFFPAHRKENV